MASFHFSLHYSLQRTMRKRDRGEKATTDKQDNQVNDRGLWPGMQGHAGSTGTDTNTSRAWRLSAVWAAMSSLITRAVLEGALPTSSVFALFSSLLLCAEGMRVTSMYTITCAIITQVFLCGCSFLMWDYSLYSSQVILRKQI